VDNLENQKEPSSSELTSDCGEKVPVYQAQVYRDRKGSKPNANK
jgi:hypothetical protein